MTERVRHHIGLIRHFANQVKDADTYGDITDVLFDERVRFGRICVWHSFSCELYRQLPEDERIKMNTIYHQKWWTLYTKSDLYNKCVLFVFKLVWFCM